ncbi:hypothetical protein CCMA1212_001976 [Trichoderma ghanense]|uniref:Uncharacterized protein n=1 Tax=Trichoderma ghanense TaxID=65468 RepID=A0ABY2HFX9_9HYPO
MPPFENAPPDYKRRTLRIWYDQVEPDLRDPELLWGTAWERFNTVKIPVLPDEEYFERALEIAKVAKDREDFHRIFRERNAKDWEELLDLMSATTRHASWHHDDFPCDDAWRKTRKASQTGSLIHFVRLLKGVAFGWEADEVRETQIDNVPSGENARIGAEYTDQGEVFPGLEDLDWEEEMALRRDQSENVTYHGYVTFFPASEPASKAPDAAVCADGDVSLMQQNPAPSRAASNSEDDRSKETQRLQRTRKRLRLSDDIINVPEPNQASIPPSADNGSVIGGSRPPSTDNDRAYKRQKLDDSTATSNTNSSCQHDESISKKRPICGDDGGRGHKRRKLNPSSQKHQEPQPSASRINKRPICDDGNEQQGHKRQKLDSSSQQHADANSHGPKIDKSMPKKRPICDDEHDNDDGNLHDDGNDNDGHSHKRQRLESSSQQPTEADSDKPRISSKQDSRRGRRKRSNANRAPGTIKTRSLNRVRPSTFWELDHTGKASIRI